MPAGRFPCNQVVFCDRRHERIDRDDVLPRRQARGRHFVVDLGGVVQITSLFGHFSVLGGLTRIHTALKIKTEMPPRGENCPSVARALTGSEADQIIATARAIPLSWVLTIEPPYGQLSLSPIAERPVRHRCFIASPSWGSIRRDNGLAA